MILPFHIVVAIASLLYTGYLFIRPSKSALYMSYALVGATLITGFYLILSKPAHLTQTCAEGLAYLAVVSLGIVAARRRFASQQQ